jgi:hypothetical protein
MQLTTRRARDRVAEIVQHQAPAIVRERGPPPALGCGDRYD